MREGQLVRDAITQSIIFCSTHTPRPHTHLVDGAACGEQHVLRVLQQELQQLLFDAVHAVRLGATAKHNNAVLPHSLYWSAPSHDVTSGRCVPPRRGNSVSAATTHKTFPADSKTTAVTKWPDPTKTDMGDSPCQVPPVSGWGGVFSFHCTGSVQATTTHTGRSGVRVNTTRRAGHHSDADANATWSRGLNVHTESKRDGLSSCTHTRTHTHTHTHTHTTENRDH